MALQADEGYVDSSSFPATPAPTPYSPLPGQGSSFNPDQVAEGIQRLHEEGLVSGASTGQPPTPAATPGPGAIAAAAAQVLKRHFQILCCTFQCLAPWYHTRTFG